MGGAGLPQDGREYLVSPESLGPRLDPVANPSFEDRAPAGIAGWSIDPPQGDSRVLLAEGKGVEGTACLQILSLIPI